MISCSFVLSTQVPWLLNFFNAKVILVKIEKGGGGDCYVYRQVLAAFC